MLTALDALDTFGLSAKADWSAGALSYGDKKRLERLERNVRRLERAVGQYNENGEPLIIQPDPETVALQGQVDGVGRCQRHGTDHPGNIELAHGPLLKGAGQVTLGAPGQGHQQHPARSFVQAMDQVGRPVAERLPQRVPVAWFSASVGEQRHVGRLVED